MNLCENFLLIINSSEFIHSMTDHTSCLIRGYYVFDVFPKIY